MKVSIIISFVAAILTITALTSMPSYAQTRSDVYNGATCIPYPATTSNITASAFPYTSFLFGFGKTAYCHFTMPDEWGTNDLSYVLFSGTTSSGQIRVRLCVYAATTSTCGAERTISAGGFTVNWVLPPSPVPSYASGAYLHVLLPDGVVSTFRQFIPVWSKP